MIIPKPIHLSCSTSCVKIYALHGIRRGKGEVRDPSFFSNRLFLFLHTMQQEDDSMQIDDTSQEAAVKEEQASKVDIDLSKKGKSLTELLALMDAYSPVIPDTVTDV